MRTIIYGITVILLGLSINSYGQEDERKSTDLNLEAQRQKQQQNYYQKALQLDSLQAKKVSDILDDYKVAIKKINMDESLGQEVRREKIKLQRDLKNQKLMSLLSPEQQRKIIPVTELAVSRGNNK